MTPCEELGYKVGDEFEVITKFMEGCKEGSIVILEEDDGTEIPIFNGRRFIHLNLVNKIEKETTMNNSLEQNIERMKKELADMEVKLAAEKKASQKWEPKCGKWVVNVRGEVMLDNIVEDRSPFGMTFQTKEQAEIASKLMRKRNRIIQYVLEHEPDYKFEFVVAGDNCYVYYTHYTNQWERAFECNYQTQQIYMPQWVAKKLVNDLNSGRVVL